MSDHGQRMVEDEINTFFPNLSEKDKKHIMEYVKEIIQMDHLLTIYSLESKDLDHALLFALIKSKTDNDSAIEQMSMAIKWNRMELAEEILNMETVQFSKEQLTSCMEQAILSDRKDFLNIFLKEENIEMKSFLTYERLESMFRYKPEGSAHMGKKRFFKALERQIPWIKSRNELTLRDIGTFLVKILEGGFKNPLRKVDYNKTPENPYDLLMIYCVLNDCSDMADLLWEYTHSPISTALICFRIYKFHAEYTCSLTAYDQDSETFCLEQADKYEEYACKSLTQCPKLFDKDDTFLLLHTPHGFWGGHSLLSIATMVGSDKFLAHGAVQNYLTDVWMGEIKSTESNIKIMLSSWLMFPLLLKYEQRERTNEEIQQLLIMEHSTQGTCDFDDQGNEMEMNVTGKKTKKKRKVMRDSLESKRKYSLNWYQKLYACYNSPIVKFQWNLIWFVVFLIIYAYLLVVDHNKICAINSSSSIAAPEVYLFLFVVGTLPTEILQLVKNPASNPIAKIWNHFSSFFNCVDGIAIFTYFVSFVIKVTTSPDLNPDYLHDNNECKYHIASLNTFYDQEFNALNAGHVLNVISFMFYVIRAMDFFKLSAEMGPKVIMIFEMIKDLFFFILLLLLFVFAYSIGAQAILRPNKDLEPPNNDYLFHLIFYRPYLMAMGEFGIEEFVDDFMIDHCDRTSLAMDCDDLKLTSLLEVSKIASVHYYFFVGLTIIYIMIANILLVNLLIAIFSNTYERLQDNSQELYLVQRAAMIMDFEHRTILPNPFSIPEHCWMIGRWIYRKFCYKESGQGKIHDTNYHKMTKVERACADEFATHKEEEEAGFVKDTLKDLKQSLISVKNILNNSSLGGNTLVRRKSSSDLDVCQVSFEEDQTKQPEKELKRISTTAIATAGIFKQVAISERPVEIHTDSRTSPYPKTKIERTEVPDSHVPWKVVWEDYSPVEYSKKRPVDKPHHHDDEALPMSLIKCFNKYRDGVNRKSFLGVYGIDEIGRPINPRGRTGISGKGNLKRWGPNLQGDVIVTRWQVDSNGKPVRHPEDGRQVLEFVAVRKQNQWAIPGGRVVEGEKLVDTLEREFSEEALGSLDMNAEKRRECMKMVDKHFGLGINVYQGYVDDPSNTDNAWFETTALSYHDSDGSSFANFPLDTIGTEEDRKSSRWITLDQNLDLYANHENIIEKVCFHRNAYCPITDETDTVEEGKKLLKKKSSLWGVFLSPENTDEADA
ncbi:transient receptor potential cation channel subfamily M member-like 2 [Bolinopsis microptera]|uniref:transient receptor potential cation channel subfamily M member-like 2 n=1 Tax=Bolinopsis microptera TaxID=2820187 RepID=UPI00307A5438